MGKIFLQSYVDRNCQLIISFLFQMDKVIHFASTIITVYEAAK